MKALKTVLMAIGSILGVGLLLLGALTLQCNRVSRPRRIRNAHQGGIVGLHMAFSQYRSDHGVFPHSIAQLYAKPHIAGEFHAQFAVVQGDPILVCCTESCPPIRKGQPVSGMGDPKYASSDIPEGRAMFMIDANGTLSGPQIMDESEFQERFGDRLQPSRSTDAEAE